MSQHYSDPRRAADPYVLPDVEMFYMSAKDIRQVCQDNGVSPDDDAAEIGYTEPGWYYWYCLPGCLPDSDPYGPFASETEALTAVAENNPEED